jgi:hypothetical protein
MLLPRAGGLQHANGDVVAIWKLLQPDMQARTQAAFLGDQPPRHASKVSAQPCEHLQMYSMRPRTAAEVVAERQHER